MNSTPETRASLLVRVRDPADRAAWHEFVEIYRPVILRLARQKGMQEADAEDVAQKVLAAVAKAVERREHDRKRAKFRTWLDRVAHNAILNALTRGRPDRGTSIDQRSDLFSLGSVLYAMCTGRAPVRAETSYGVLRRITDEEPRPIREINPDIPEWLCRIVARLMSKRLDDRFQSAREVAELLEECLAHVQQPTAALLPASLATQSGGCRFFSISLRSLGVIAMIAAFAFGLLGMVLWQAATPPDISGKWPGEQWGTVVLEAKQPGQYEGSYTGSDNARSGAVHLKWSRIERRFNGAWEEGDDRNGKISLRLVGDEIRGAWTTDEKSQKESRTPRLADLLWTRSSDNNNESRQRADADSGLLNVNPPPPTNAMPKRMRLFTALTIGNSVKIACSAGGRLIALANGNPTRIMQTGGTSRVKDNWKPSADILDAATGKTVVSLNLSTAEEDVVLAVTERISHLEATTLAFSPDGNVVAVGTSIGQVKLFDARTGELVRSLDDEAAKLADKETPQNWRSLRRAMGSVASLAFSPDGSLLAVCGGSLGDSSNVFDGVQRLGIKATGPGRLKLWEVKTGSLKHDLVGHSHAHVVTFSSDGHLLASAGRWFKDGDWGNGVILWNPHTGTRIRSDIRVTANGGVRSVAFSPDGKLLAIGTQRFDGDSSTGGVSLVRLSSATTEWLVTVPGWAKPVAFLPDGKDVAVLCGGASTRFLETGTGTMNREIRPADPLPDVRWNDFAIASQARMLAIGGVDNERKGSVELWGWGNTL